MTLNLGAMVIVLAWCVLSFCLLWVYWPWWQLLLLILLPLGTLTLTYWYFGIDWAMSLIKAQKILSLTPLLCQSFAVLGNKSTTPSKEASCADMNNRLAWASGSLALRVVKMACSRSSPTIGLKIGSFFDRPRSVCIDSKQDTEHTERCNDCGGCSLTSSGNGLCSEGRI
jgi:hypothetical protein